MKIVYGIMLEVICTVIFSCDCLHHIQGVVIDAETQLPIYKVIITKNKNGVIYTDSLGSFEFTSMTGGLFGCSKISLFFKMVAFYV